MNTSIYITTPGVSIKKRGTQLIVQKDDQVLEQVPLGILTDITLFETVHISSQAITECLERNIPITWMTGYGKYVGSMTNIRSTDVLKQQQQFALYNNMEFRLAMAKKIVLAKTKNQMVLLKRYARNIEEGLIQEEVSGMIALQKNVPEAKDIPTLMGYEGIMSRHYFSALGKVVPTEFAFATRTKQPPKDPFNALLGIGYSMLHNEIIAALCSKGLHPFVGFFHSIAKGHPALASDLIEEWRAPIVDALLLNLVKRNSLDPSHFEKGDEGGCYLTYEGRKIVIGRYHGKMLTENEYFNSKATYRDSLKEQAWNYARAVMNENPDLYTPLEIY